jgi:hypothetical protein
VQICAPLSLLQHKLHSLCDVQLIKVILFGKRPSCHESLQEEVLQGQKYTSEENAFLAHTFFFFLVKRYSLTFTIFVFFCIFVFSSRLGPFWNFKSTARHSNNLEEKRESKNNLQKKNYFMTYVFFSLVLKIDQCIFFQFNLLQFTLQFVDVKS